MSDDVALAASAPSRSRGLTLLAALLVASPALQWAYVSGLAYLTILEPPFTTSRGFALALQLFFAPGNILAVVLGVGLLLRSEWTRRIARVVFLIAVVLGAWFVGVQVATSRYDSNVLPAGASLALAAFGLWILGRPDVRRAFGTTKARRSGAGSVATRADSSRRAATAAVLPQRDRVEHPRVFRIAAAAAIVLGIGAVALLVHLHGVLAGTWMLNPAYGDEAADAERVIRTTAFVVLVVLLAPHALGAWAAASVLVGRDAVRAMRRYALVTCWSTIACALVTGWLTTHGELVFDAGLALLILGFCGVSFLAHACFVYLVARSGVR